MGLLPGDVETEGTPRAIVRDLDRSDDPRFADTPARRTAGAFMARDIAAACMTRSDTRGFVLEAVGKFSFDVSLCCFAPGELWLEYLGFVVGGKTRFADCPSYESGQAKETGFLTGICKVLFANSGQEMGGNTGHFFSLNGD